MTYHPTSGPGGDQPPGPFTGPGPVRLPSEAAPAGAGSIGPPVASLPPELAEQARTLFHDRLPVAAAYAELLATDGVLRGLIGPREASRIWTRHLLNCAPVAELIPDGSSVLDVGSGAGLPGIVLAIARPDLSVVLVEPLARRTAFLAEVVTALDLARSVTVCRGRAEEVAGASSRSAGNAGPARPQRPAAPGSPGEMGLPATVVLPGDVLLPADIVTARAVAPLDRLAGWCLPLAAPGGRVLALKGATAVDEVTQHAEAVARLGGGPPVLRRCGVGIVDPPTTVVEIVRERVVEVTRPGRSRAGAVRARPSRSAKPRDGNTSGRGRPGRG